MDLPSWEFPGFQGAVFSGWSMFNFGRVINLHWCPLVQGADLANLLNEGAIMAARKAKSEMDSDETRRDIFFWKKQFGNTKRFQAINCPRVVEVFGWEHSFASEDAKKNLWIKSCQLTEHVFAV